MADDNNDDEPRPKPKRKRPIDEGFEAVEPGAKPRPKRPRDDDDRPRSGRPRDEDDDLDDRPRRRRRRDEDDDEEDATGGLIPYKNGKALASYYCGVFSLIPCFGAILGPIAIVLGFLGYSYANTNPRAAGKVHAVVGIVLGTLVVIGHIGLLVVLIAAGAFAK